MPPRTVARVLNELQCLDLLTTGSDANRSGYLYYMHAQVDADRLGKLVGRFVSTAEVRTAEICVAEVYPSQVRSPQVRTTQVGSTQISI
jgi:hypothetical protein